jgi:hypothetical protein
MNHRPLTLQSIYALRIHPHCMQSSTFTGFSPSEASEVPGDQSRATTASPAHSPRAAVPRQPPVRSNMRARNHDDGLTVRVDNLTNILNEIRHEHKDLMARLSDLECAAGRIEAAFGHLSGAHAIIQGRSSGNFRGRGGYGRGFRHEGPPDRGFRNDGPPERGFRNDGPPERGTPPPGHFRPGRGRDQRH